MYLDDRVPNPHIEPENGIINLMRGDSLSFPIKINDGTKLFPEYRGIHLDERIYFALLQPNQAFEDAVVKMVLTPNSEKTEEGYPILKLEPKDTLRLLVGKYYYCVKLRKVIGEDEEEVRTLIPNTLFYLNGSNPEKVPPLYYQKGDYFVDNIILDGGVIE